jgi:hypothetical protein
MGVNTVAHFAKIKNNIVTEVLVIGNELLNNLEFPESEPLGQEYLKNLGFDGEWLQTSYNNKFRYRYACIGGMYYRSKDVFLTIKPFPSWKLDEHDFSWKPPQSMPDSRSWVWDEDSQSWKDPIDIVL